MADRGLSPGSTFFRRLTLEEVIVTAPENSPTFMDNYDMLEDEDGKYSCLSQEDINAESLYYTTKPWIFSQTVKIFWKSPELASNIAGVLAIAKNKPKLCGFTKRFF